MAPGNAFVPALAMLKPRTFQVTACEKKFQAAFGDVLVIDLVVEPVSFTTVPTSCPPFSTNWEPEAKGLGELQKETGKEPETVAV